MIRVRTYKYTTEMNQMKQFFMISETGCRAPVVRRFFRLGFRTSFAPRKSAAHAMRASENNLAMNRSL